MISVNIMNMPIDKFLTDQYDLEEENLLEYLTTVALKFCPDFVFEADGTAVAVGSQAPFIFKRRYNNGKLDMPFDYNNYIKGVENNNEAAIDIIRAIGIDPEKFWYLLLFVYDYVTGSTKCTMSVKPSPTEEIERLIEYVECNEQSFDLLKGITHSRPMTLTINKDRAHKLSITNPNTISLIASICKEALPRLRANSLFNRMETDNDVVSKSMSVRIWLFSEMFRYFFEQYPQFSNKRKTGYTTTRSSLRLISKLIYLVGLTDNKNYDLDDDNLKAVLKQYRTYKIDTINSIYG